MHEVPALNWPAVLALTAFLVFIGRLVDFLLLKTHHEHIILILWEAEEKIAKFSIRQRQILLAQGCLHAWESLAKTLSRSIDKIGEKTYVYVCKRCSSKLSSLFLLWTLVTIHTVSTLSFLFFAIFYIDGAAIHFSASMAVWLLALSSLTTVYSGTIQAIQYLGLTSAKYRSALLLMRPMYLSLLVFVISAIFSCCAILVGSLLEVPDQSNSTLGHWLPATRSNGFSTSSVFHFSTSSVFHFSTPYGLAMANFPFDLFTILISLKLLRWLADNGKWIGLIALVDIILSAAATVFLHATIKMFTTPRVNFLIHLEEALRWFINLVTLSASPESPDWSLSPILLTTFLPVALYMFAFVVASFVLRPAKIVSGYLVKVLGDKGKFPFSELGVIVGMGVAAVKAVAFWLSGWTELSSFLKLILP